MAAPAKTTTREAHSGHHHHHDNSYLVSSNKNDAGVRITRIGLYSNLGMAVAKGVGGYAFNSQAMVADAWHSLTDLASDVLTLATLSWSLKPPTAKFPAGFGKVECLGSLGVSGMLLGGGIFMCLNSSEILWAHFMLDAHAAAEVAMHAHGHSHGSAGPSLHAAWLALGTVAIKEWLYQKTMAVAKERKSAVLASNAVHHRVDSLTGIVTLLAILGANLLHEAAWLDPVGGLLISLLVIKAGFGNTMDSLFELADKSVEDGVKKSVRKAAEKSFTSLSGGGEIKLREVQGVKSGQNYLLDLDIAVPSNFTLDQMRDVESTARKAVGSTVRGARRVKVRFVPLADTSATLLDEFIPSHVSPQDPESDQQNDYDHDHSHSHSKKSN